MYCMRGLYVHRIDWDGTWLAWYYLRPVVSLIVGGVSYLFLKAGLLVLDSSSEQQIDNPYGFLSLAFIAGLNVDRFLKRIEEVAMTTWGVSPSRASNSHDESKDGH